MATIMTLNSRFNTIKSYHTKTKIHNGHLVVTLNSRFNTIKKYHTKQKV